MFLLFVTIAAWLPLITSIAGALALVAHVVSAQFRARVSIFFLFLLITSLRVMYPLLLTVMQWWVWSHNALGKILLLQPLDSAVPLPWEGIRALFAAPGGYFAFYVIGRFWLSLIALGCVAGVFAGAFLLARRIRKDRSQDGSVLVAFTAALIAGWPGVVVFVPLWVIMSLGNAVYAFGYHRRMTVSLSLAVAVLIVAVFAPTLLPYLYIHVLAF